MSKIYIRVAVNAQVRGLFDYALPSKATTANSKDLIGRRVRAPWGNREVIGIIMETSPTPAIAAARVKPLKQIYDDMPPLPAATLQLIRFCAEYYHSPIGLVAACALPVFFRRANTLRPPAGYRLATPAPANAPPLVGNAAAVLTLLANGTVKTAADIKETVPYPHAALKKLLGLRLIERCHLGDAPTPALPAATPPRLSAAQQQVMTQLQLDDGFAPNLLFGATGSGKSEIYMNAMAQVLAQGRQVLILTPEIHLTPQLEAHFRRRFPAQRLAVLHSGLSDGERARRWLQARQGEAQIVLGTRLAVFTPLPALGLIVVDEEHDDSFKQEQGGILFSARNVAVWRAKNEKIPFIAGSATPALESLHNASKESKDGWRLLTLSQRISGTPPKVALCEERDPLYHGLSQEFINALTENLNAGKQCMVFINRRGYAASLLCRSCSQAHKCRHCSHNMTVHRRRDILACHLCGFTMPIPLSCGSCGGDFAPVGSGTQRVEESLARLFPQVRALRLDRDAKQDALATHTEAIKKGDIQLLVGTQLIAKGHDFPALAFIGILNADAALSAADLRAEERLFALLSQVIGRGTRNPAGCRVLVQTRHPAHPFYQELQNDDVRVCWQRLLDERRRAVMPPFSHLAVLRGKGKDPKRLERFMRQAVEQARKLAPKTIQVFDAVPPHIEKISDWHRRQMLIHARQRTTLQRFLHAYLPTLPSGGSSNWVMEVDPLNV